MAESKGLHQSIAMIQYYISTVNVLAILFYPYVSLCYTHSLSVLVPVCHPLSLPLLLSPCCSSLSLSLHSRVLYSSSLSHSLCHPPAMVRLAAYGAGSSLLAGYVVLSAFRQRSNFFSAAVYLSKSNACMMVCLEARGREVPSHV